MHKQSKGWTSEGDWDYVYCLALNMLVDSFPVRKKPLYRNHYLPNNGLNRFVINGGITYCFLSAP